MRRSCIAKICSREPEANLQGPGWLYDRAWMVGICHFSSRSVGLRAAKDPRCRGSSASSAESVAAPADRPVRRAAGAEAHHGAVGGTVRELANPAGGRVGDELTSACRCHGTRRRRAPGAGCPSVLKKRPRQPSGAPPRSRPAYPIELLNHPAPIGPSANTPPPVNHLLFDMRPSRTPTCRAWRSSACSCGRPTSRSCTHERLRERGVVRRVTMCAAQPSSGSSSASPSSSGAALLIAPNGEPSTGSTPPPVRFVEVGRPEAG